MKNVNKIAADILKKKADSDVHFSAAELTAAMQKMQRVSEFELEKIFESSGISEMKFESVKFKDFHFSTVFDGGNKSCLTAMYECTFLDDDPHDEDQVTMRTNNFVMWDGKKYTADVSGVSHKV
jgi:hypothetical protein